MFYFNDGFAPLLTEDAPPTAGGWILTTALLAWLVLAAFAGTTGS